MVRIPVFIVVIAAFVTILQMLMSAYAPDSINQALGIYIPLIVVNCIILGRAESFAAKNSPIASLFDGIGCGLGFTLGLTILGSAREILGAGSVFGITLLPETTNILMFILPPVTVHVALNYGGRDELRRAVTKIARETADGTLSPDAITEDTISDALDTAGTPDPELMIRTSGEERISNFLLWQIAYSEFFFSDTLWPDFDKKELERAIYYYQNRERRFGGRVK